MPATNEEFIKKAFEAGLTEDQVRAALKERNSRGSMTSAVQPKKSNPLMDVLGFGTDIAIPETKEFMNAGANFAQNNPKKNDPWWQQSPAFAAVGAMQGSEKDKQYLKDYIDTQRHAAASGVELGSYLLGKPDLKKVGGWAAKLPYATQGMFMGALKGLVNPESKSVQETAGNVASQGATGGATGLVFDAASAVGRKVIPEAKKIVKRLFKPSGNDVIKFENQTGMDFGDEIAKRDGKNIFGKSWDQLKVYFGDKFNAAKQNADELASTSTKTVKKKVLLDLIDDQIAKNSKTQGFVSPQSEATISYLTNVRQNVEQQADDLTMGFVNNVKKSLQGSTSYNGYDIFEEPVKNLARETRRLLENNIDGFGDANKSIQLYKIASDALEKRVESLSKQESQDLLGKMLNMSPYLLGVGGGIAGGPLGALGGIAGGLGLGAAKNAYQSPQVQTKLMQASTPKIFDILARLGINVSTNR